LINNPQSFFSSPVYQAAFNQGTAAVSAQQNAGGFLGSSNAAGALQAYGQTFGQQQLLSQEQLLAGMSGTGFNPAAAGSSASNSAQLSAGNLASLGGLLAFFGNSQTNPGGGSSGGGFVPLNSSSLAGTTSGWGAGADAIVLP
jgi:hypothetical protein